MRYRQLGQSGLHVSAVCLGTMTFGEQNSEPEAHAQLDAAVDAGVNFIDTAEMYPVPPRAETQGATETHVGRWLKRRGIRDRLVVATKVAGPADWLTYLRDGTPRLDKRNIELALDASLRRLQTDYIDLYQLHWPERDTNYFGKLGYVHTPENDGVPIEETLSALAALVATGKVRHIGISNETPWGVMRFIRAAEAGGAPRIASIQNPYNLLNRTFEIGLAEMALRERVGLLAYSPLAFGALSGKYLGGKQPPGARLSLFSRFTRYSNEQGAKATSGYVSLAHRYGLDPAQMALAYVGSRPFVTSTIIGATTLTQLRDDMAGVEMSLPPELVTALEAIHTACPNPCP